MARRDQDQKEKTVVNNVASLGLFWFGFVVVGSLGGQAVTLLSGRLGTFRIVQLVSLSQVLRPQHLEATAPSCHAQHGAA